MINTCASLQSHSFVKWCSSLPRKALNSGTPFGAFLHSTFHITRSDSVAPAKLLFPLPVPKTGLFEPLPFRCSSRRRRKVGFGQAFYVLVMALNFLHADCSFVGLPLLGVRPNRAQQVAFANLRGLLKAFGNCAGEVNVPASGRCSTFLVSLLADLSDFFTRHGLSGSAYESGLEAAVQSGEGLDVDLSRAKELTPYRPLDPTRLKLAGTAQWSPLDFLEDDLWLPLVEPQVLLWTKTFDNDDLPKLNKEDPEKVIAPAKVWEVNGLLHFSPKPIDDEMKPSCLRVFNCYKSPTQDRQIGDRRGRNQLEAYMPGVSRSLPSGPNLSCLEIDPTSQRLAICLSDRKDFYHQLQVSVGRAESNAMWPPLRLSDFKGTHAYDKLVASHLASKKKKPREAEGDFLGDPRGDHLGVEIATQSHRLIIDDFFSVSVEEGLLGPSEKDIVSQEVGKVTGAELDGSSFTRGLGLCTVSAPASKRLSLSFPSLQLASLGATTNALHACLVGGRASCLMFRRPLMSILDRVHPFADLSSVNQEDPQVLQLPRLVAQEFVLLGILAPLMCADVSAPISTSIFAFDASDLKGAVVRTEVDQDLARGLWRTGRKKGRYTRLLSREKALLSKIDTLWEDEVPEEKIRHPGKPLAMRYHFIEICGGAGKVTKFVEREGLVVGPVIDIDLFPACDFCLLQLLSWLCFMVEGGRLDSFLLAPPCTTFSLAAHPPLRSYDVPRGFHLTERRTLLGTTLALRSLSLIMVAARTRVIGLLETPRRSKVAWLQEWIYFLEALIADETGFASCSFGSIHQKEFRLLGCNLEIDRLNFPCTRDHSHVKIEGGYTRPSSTYTDDLAWMFASEIARAINIKIRMQQAEEVEVIGLESIVSNDIAESLPWSPMLEWRWRKKDVHINIKEASAFGRLVYWMACNSPKSRFSVGLGSFVAISAIIKGRSASYGLRPAPRRIGASLVAGCLYPSLHFFPTRSNKADHPTRNVAIPDPVPHSILFTGDMPEVISLTKIPGLKRFATNWVRVVLLIFGRPPPWSRSNDSWRFHHYAPGAYPVLWNSPAARKVKHDGFGFDASLGFPGEGPIGFLLVWICALGLAAPPGRCPGCPGFSVFCGSCVSPVGVVPCLFRRHFSVLSRIVFVVSNDLSHSAVWAAPVDASHGQLFPRDKGDKCRLDQRKGIILDEGRPVLAKTKDSREKLLRWFDDWLQSQDMTLEALLDPKTLDVETVNLVLEKYGRALYNGGRPYGHYSETINAVGSKRPNLRRTLQGAWNLAFTWLREEPPVHHVALPWQVLASLVSVAYLWGWNRTAGVLALSWGALTRIGEVIKAQRRHLVLPRDLAYTIKYALLQIEEPKTRFRSARHQVARFDQPQLLSVIEVSFQDLRPDDSLWNFSPQTLRLRFQKLLQALKLDALPPSVSKGLDLGSLRAGGASWLMITSEDSELVRRRGRWLTSKIMEIYVQEVSAIQFLPQLPPQSRLLVIDGVGLFPILLQKVRYLHDCGIPETAWKYLLTDGRTNADHG